MNFLLFLAPFSWGTQKREAAAPKANGCFLGGTQETFGTVSGDLLGGTGKAEDAKLPGAGIGPKQCPENGPAEKGASLLNWKIGAVADLWACAKENRKDHSRYDSRLPWCEILLESNRDCAGECDAAIPAVSSPNDLVGRNLVAWSSWPGRGRRVSGCDLETSEPRKPRARFRCPRRSPRLRAQQTHPPS